MPGVGREVAEIEGLDGRVLDSGEVEVIGGQPVAEATAAGVHLDVKRVSGEVLLQFDEVVAAAEGAELRDAPFGTASASPGRQPVVGDRDHVALGVGAVHRGSVALYVVGGPAADDGFEFSPVEGLEAGAADLARPQRDPAGDLLVEAAPVLRRGRLRRHLARRAEHPAAHIESYGAERDRPRAPREDAGR